MLTLGAPLAPLLVIGYSWFFDKGRALARELLVIRYSLSCFGIRGSARRPWRPGSWPPAEAGHWCRRDRCSRTLDHGAAVSAPWRASYPLFVIRYACFLIPN